MTTQFFFETNIAALPALNYFAFYRQYKIFEAGAAPYFQESKRIRDEVIYLLREGDTPANLITKLENSKQGLLDGLQIELRPLLALSCLCTEQTFEGKRMPVSCNVANDEALNKLAIEIYDNYNSDYFAMITHVGIMFEKMQRQLSKAFPKLFETDLAPFVAAQAAIRRIDLEDEDSLMAELRNIQTAFLQAHKPLALISDEQNFDDAYWTETFQLADKLGMSQADLAINSISAYFAKLQNRKEKDKKTEEINQLK
jgi:hypothetical protein